MQEKNKGISLQEAQRLAASPAGKQLMNAVAQSGSDQLREAAQLFSQGNYEQAKRILSPILSSPEIQKLLKQLGGQT